MVLLGQDAKGSGSSVQDLGGLTREQPVARLGLALYRLVACRGPLRSDSREAWRLTPHQVCRPWLRPSLEPRRRACRQLSSGWIPTSDRTPRGDGMQGMLE
jgi:hypothetical protein